MRAAAYLLCGVLLTLVQGVFYQLSDAFPDWSALSNLGPWLSRGYTPDLVLPLVIYLGIHEASISRGATLSFALGWTIDILGGGPAFLFRFTMVALWWLARAASTRVSAQSGILRIPLAFLFSLVESAIILTFLAIFGLDSGRPLELGAVVLPRALSTALFAPLIFGLAHRISLEGWGHQVTQSQRGNY